MTSTLHCSFCGKPAGKVAKLIAGPKANICEACVAICWDVLQSEIPEVLKTWAAERQVRVSVDQLTRVFNDRFVLESLRLETMRARRYGRPLAVLVLHVDDFASHNRRFGEGVLRQLADRLQGRFRGQEIVGRVEVECFLVLIPGSGRQAALGLAEEVRLSVAGKPFSAGDEEVTLTVSVGVADLDDLKAQQRPAEAEAHELLEIARDRSSVAKAHGGNRVEG